MQPTIQMAQRVSVSPWKPNSSSIGLQAMLSQQQQQQQQLPTPTKQQKSSNKVSDVVGLGSPEAIGGGRDGGGGGYPRGDVGGGEGASGGGGSGRPPVGEGGGRESADRGGAMQIFGRHSQGHATEGDFRQQAPIGRWQAGQYPRGPSYPRANVYRAGGAGNFAAGHYSMPTVPVMNGATGGHCQAYMYFPEWGPGGDWHQGASGFYLGEDQHWHDATPWSADLGAMQ